LTAATVPLLTGDGPTVDPAVLTVLAAAIANHERVRFGYRANDGAETTRLAEPHRLVAAGRRWYLVAYDNNRDDWRIFRVDRVREPLATGSRVALRELPAEDAAAYVTDKMYSLAPTYQAVVTLHASAEEMAARWGNHAGDLEAIDKRTCRLRSHTDTLEWLAFRLTTLGCEFDVHEPPELAAHLHELGARVTRAAAAHAGKPASTKETHR
jgi:predicted DNA-binding transcriptional regulator YafY